MKFFLDTANLAQIREACEMGVLSLGVLATAAYAAAFCGEEEA